jgi:hypothetical protein
MIIASGFASKQANSPALLVLPYTLVAFQLPQSMQSMTFHQKHNR